MIIPYISVNVSHIAVIHYEWENCNSSFNLLFVDSQPQWLAFSSVYWSLIMSSPLNFYFGFRRCFPLDRLVSAATAKQHHAFTIASDLLASVLAQWKVLKVLLLQVTPSLTAACRGLGSLPLIAGPDPSCWHLWVSMHICTCLNQVWRLLRHLFYLLWD